MFDKMTVEEISQRLEQVIQKSDAMKKEGEVATYLPCLSQIDPNGFATSIATTSGKVVESGDCDIKFSIQSISKVIDFMIALEDVGAETVFSKINTECTRYPYNSVRAIDDRVANPFINAGALTVCSLLKGRTVDERFQRVADKIKQLSGADDIRTQKEFHFVTDINRSLVYYLRGVGLIDSNVNVEEVLDLYVRICFIELNAREMAHVAGVLANGGRSLDNRKQVIDEEIVKMGVSLMATCGMYESSGKFLMETGFPAKSGVSGGIMAVVPGKCGICTYSPRLDEEGNSLRGNIILSDLSKEFKLHMFV